jgi:hypothetical protein
MVIQCACGAVIRAGSEAELLDKARLHIHGQHPEVGEPPSSADLLAMASEEPMPAEGRRSPHRSTEST